MKCEHCDMAIVHYSGKLCHSSDLIFPQYCRVDPGGESQLHEPEDKADYEPSCFRAENGYVGD